MSLGTDIENVMGKLHRASCILGYVAENALSNDDVFVGETIKAAEALVLDAYAQLRERRP
jgi:hypothetical protein